jgi:hypothetical protein
MQQRAIGLRKEYAGRRKIAAEVTILQGSFSVQLLVVAK